MIFKSIFILYLLSTFTFVRTESSNEAIDSSFLESVLDATECDRQITTIRENLLLLMQFVDAGIRLPKGILIGSTVDLGNYHQCLGIKHFIDGMDIQGKYCSIQVPLNQTFHLPDVDLNTHPWNFIPNTTFMDQEIIRKIGEFKLRRAQILAMNGDFHYLEEYDARTVPRNPLSSVVLTLAVCIPRPCTTQRAITSLLSNMTAVDFDYTENYCRLRGDKPWVSADYAAVIVFSIIGFISLLSTSYDIVHRFFLKSDLKIINPIYQSFSVYTNTQRLVMSTTSPGTLQCMDGIRTLAMVWVIMGHSFGSEPHMANMLEIFNWMYSAKGLWITTAPITVDTFFTLAGILLVYTTAKKITAKKFLKNLHWFYVSRIVRITPLLAVAVLLEASFYNQLTDGPAWEAVAARTNTCRDVWWYTILHIQNLFTPRSMCVSHSWYIAIDMHIYMVSPLILYWIFTGKKRDAWLALVSGLLAVLISSTIYNFIKSVPGGIFVQNRGEDRADYVPVYYVNTLTRASPFFVGLIFGYVLHLYRDKKVILSWIILATFWFVSIGIGSSIFYFKYQIMQSDWNNQFVDNFMNSFMRPAWACAISWLIFACVNGYAGPVNWFLSLDLWKVPSRLTYGMYLYHYPLMYAINGSAVTPVYFTVSLFMFKFLSHLVLATIASYILTVLVDSPCAALYRQLFIKVQKQQTQQVEKENKTKEENYKTDQQTRADKFDEALEKNGDSIPTK